MFQSAVRDEAKVPAPVGPPGATKLVPRPAAWAGNAFVAKAPDEFWGKCSRATDGRREKVTRFRHELASALGVLECLRAAPVPDDWAALPADGCDLALYLIASHHGKVRLSVRTMPSEKPVPLDPTRLFAAGVWGGDPLPATDLGGGVTAAGVRLYLSPIQLGGESWTARTLDVLSRLGPFRLAHLEAVVRAADYRASAKGDGDA